jgi:hypothetical protein
MYVEENPVPIIHDQGDQIGRISAHWSIIFFGQFFLITEGAQIFFATFIPRRNLCINFDKNGLDYNLGDFSQTHLVTQSKTNF